jgi:TolA protein
VAQRKINIATMPWTSSLVEDVRFRKIATATLAAFLILGIIIPIIKVPDITREPPKPIPQRLVKLILEKKKEPPKPKPQELSEAEKRRLEEERKKRLEELKKEQEKRQKELEEERKKRLAEEKKRQEELEKQREKDRQLAEEERRKREEERRKAEAERQKLEEERRRAEAERQRREAEAERQRQAAEAERRRQEEARRRAEEERRRQEAERQRIAAEKAKGEQMAKDLASQFDFLADDTATQSVTQDNNALTKGGGSEQIAAAPKSNVIGSRTASAGSGSRGIGGIATDDSQLGVGAGDVALGPRTITSVQAIDFTDGAASAGDTPKVGADGRAVRSRSQLMLVFERIKGKLHSHYRRALRRDPTLSGKVVVWLRILPNGVVDDIRIESSELDAASFLSRIQTLIKSTNFGAEDVGTAEVTYPLDFTP